MIDVQATSVAPQFAIESVGVSALRYPILAQDDDGRETQRTAAHWRLGVPLAADRRGTHMSRFVAAVEAAHETPMGLAGHFAFTTALARTLEAEGASVTTDFTWFRRVRAPVSGHVSHLECAVTFRSVAGAQPVRELGLTVAAKALCPCSKAISDRGAHNQRSDLTARVELAPDATLGIDTLARLLESCASSPVYPLLKREDEKHVTEIAYDNPAFVEDLVRRMALRLSDLPGAVAFVAEAVNHESIHAHDCFARISHRR
jgi:GTP cyclohydrolase I